MPALQRVRQFFGALTARVEPSEDGVAEGYLSAASLVIFRSMPVNDRRHALNVLYRLLESGHRDRDLLQAALLHDAGKARARLSVLARVAVVLARRVDGRILDRLARPEGGGWRHTLHIYCHHAAIGAALAAHAGCNPEVVRLIANHSRRPSDALSRALYEADERS